jgi:hypothetical protein
MEKKTLFEILTEGFQVRNNRSHDKKTLLSKEIEAHEKLFDEILRPLPLEIHSKRRPISGLHYTDGDILQIRDAYKKFIVNGADINEAGEFFYVNKKSINKENDIWFADGQGRNRKKFPPSDIELHYYNEAKMRFEYLQFLRNYKPEVSPKPEKRTVKDIALQYHWMNKPITNQNKDEVAAMFPELKLKNGTSLYHKYLSYNTKTDRTGLTDMSHPERENRKHLTIMETALKFLSEKKHIETAENEILEFKTNVKRSGGKII